MEIHATVFSQFIVIILTSVAGKNAGALKSLLNYVERVEIFRILMGREFRRLNFIKHSLNPHLIFMLIIV